VIAMIITLNQVLEDKGISQNQLAKDTGISVETIRNFKNNKTSRISFDVLEKVCNYLGCGIEDIMRLEKGE
jgi:putative transcriptional regulator